MSNTDGFNANDVQAALIEAGVQSVGAEIAVVSGRKNKTVFRVIALFKNGDKDPNRVYVTTERDAATKQHLPKIIEELKNECIKQGYANGTAV